MEVFIMEAKYLEMDFILGNSLDNVVNKLLEHKEKGELVSGNFNGTMLYSDTVTMDDAYKQVTGKTKSEFDQAVQQREAERKQRREEHEKSIPELTSIWREKGKEVLAADKLERWNEIVPIRLNDLYRGMELGACLDVISILNDKGTLVEAKDKLDSQGHSGASLGLVCSMIQEFCERGNEFVSYVR